MAYSQPGDNLATAHPSTALSNTIDYHRRELDRLISNYFCSNTADEVMQHLNEAYTDALMLSSHEEGGRYRLPQGSQLPHTLVQSVTTHIELLHFLAALSRRWTSLQRTIENEKGGVQ